VETYQTLAKGIDVPWAVMTIIKDGGEEMVEINNNGL